MACLLFISSIQTSFGSTLTLDLVIYSDGTAHILSQLDVDPLVTDFELELFGSAIDNFVVVNENGVLLNTNFLDNSVLIETFGSSVITVEYDIHDLVSKQGRVWTFSLDAPSDFTLLLPKNSAIVGMINLPINMEIVNDQQQLTLSTGETEISYLFSAIPFIDPPTIDPSTGEPDLSLEYFIIFILISTLSITIIISIKKIRNANKKTRPGGILTVNRKWDVFISHASEDKKRVAKPLAEKLRAEGFKVWFDEWQIKIGMNLRESIEDGLSKSNFGIVILSKKFFNKEWTKLELDGLISIMTNTHNHNIFPILYGITHDELITMSPILANTVSRSWEGDTDKIVKEIIEVIEGKSERIS